MKPVGPTLPHIYLYCQEVLDEGVFLRISSLVVSCVMQ